MSRLGLVGSWKGPDDVLVLMRPTNSEFGGSGGGLDRVEQVQGARLPRAKCPKCRGWGLSSIGSVMGC